MTFPTVIVKASGETATDQDVKLDTPVGAAGLLLVIDITDEDTGGGAGAVTVTIQGYDPASGKLWTILASASLATVATTLMRVHHNLAAAANVAAKDILPPQIRINVNHTNANPMIYSIGAHFTA